VHVPSSKVIFVILPSSRVTSFTAGPLLLVHVPPPVTVIFGVAIYPEPPLSVLRVRSALRVAVAFDVGAGMVKVGRVAQVPERIISSSVPFTILVVAVNPFGQDHPVDVIFGGYIYPDHFLVMFAVMAPDMAFLVIVATAFTLFT